MSFQQGLSGLNSSAKNLDAIGNNVANASTVGFKGSQTQFADAYAASLSGGGSLQTGSGSRVAAIAQQFSQGNVSTTNNPLDIAISGSGFFRLADPSGAIYYSRNGQFHEDKDGYIVNSLGHHVTGYETALVGGVTQIAQVQPPVKLQISATDKSNPPKVTSAAAVSVNLISTATGISNTATPFDPNISTTYNNSTALAIYDSTGASHVASLYFQRQPLAATSAPASINAGASSVTLASAVGLSVGNTITLPGAALGVATSSAAIVPPAATTVTVGSTVGMTVGDNITLPGAGAAGPSTTAAATVIGATTATLASVANLAIGDNITITGDAGAHTISAINTATNVVTFAPPTAAPTAGGANVTSTKALTTTITNINAGTGVVTFAAATTTATLANAVISTGIPLTTTITGIVGNVVSFSPATTAPTIAGATVSTNAGSNTWNVFMTVGGTSVPAVVPPAAATPMTQLVFDNSGTLASPLAAVPVTPTLKGVATPMTFDLTKCTQYAGTFNVNALTQNGYAAGTLSGYSTDANGTILGRYTNGQTQPLGQLVLNSFSNPQGLQPVGNNEWVDTVAAGNLGPLTPGTSGRGVLQSSAVEDSNVDLTAELVNMIVAQRMYQANAQTIKAQDQILQTIVNLK